MSRMPSRADHVPPAHWFLIFWHYLVAFYFLARLLFHVTKDRNVQTSDVGNIYYLSKEQAFPGIKATECSDAVPRTGGMKISLFIMEANQISDAVCLLAKGRWRRVERQGWNQYTPEFIATLTSRQKAWRFISHIWSTKVKTGHTVKIQINTWPNFYP